MILTTLVTVSTHGLKTVDLYDENKEYKRGRTYLVNRELNLIERACFHNVTGHLLSMVNDW